MDDRVILLRHGSKELDSSSPPERSSPVMLSAAKQLPAERDRSFAALRMTCRTPQSRQILRGAQSLP